MAAAEQIKQAENTEPSIQIAEWIIPAKPVEYRICVQDAAGDYMCEVYK